MGAAAAAGTAGAAAALPACAAGAEPPGSESSFTFNPFMSALEPWEAEHTYLNFAETRRKPTTLFSSASYDRLRQIKAIFDPHDVIRSNHPVPAAR